MKLEWSQASHTLETGESDSYNDSACKQEEMDLTHGHVQLQLGILLSRHDQAILNIPLWATESELTDVHLRIQINWGVREGSFLKITATKRILRITFLS